MVSYSSMEWMLFSAYLVSALFAIVGNGLIIHLIRVTKKTSNTFQLIVNQCCSDAICGSIYMSLWFFCSTNCIKSGNGFGLFNCECVLLIKVATFFVSIYTMTVISVDRYVKLYYPHSRGLKARISIPLTWFAGILTALFCNPHFQVAEFFTPGRLIGCRVALPFDLGFLKKHYNFGIVLLLVGSAFGIISFSYYKVIRKIYSRQTLGLRNDAKLKQMEDKKRNTILMLIVMVVSSYTLCGPLFVVLGTDYWFIQLLPAVCNENTIQPVWYLIIYFTCVSSTSVNPFIFFYFNREFRYKLLEYIGISPSTRKDMSNVQGDADRPSTTTTRYSSAFSDSTSGLMLPNTTSVSKA